MELDKDHTQKFKDGELVGRFIRSYIEKSRSEASFPKDWEAAHGVDEIQKAVFKMTIKEFIPDAISFLRNCHPEKDLVKNKTQQENILNSIDEIVSVCRKHGIKTIGDLTTETQRGKVFISLIKFQEIFRSPSAISRNFSSLMLSINFPFAREVDNF